MAKVVLLDLDGVLVRPAHGAWRRFLEWAAPCTPKKLTVEKVLEKLDPVWARYYEKIIRLELNRDNEAAFWYNLAKDSLRALESECSADDLLADWQYYMFIEPVPGARALVEWLKLRGYTVAVYANTVPSLREHLDRQGLGPFVDHAFPCNEVGYVKPDGRGYRKVAELLRVAPNEIIYFDDEKYNVRYARQVGYRAYLVQLGKPGPEIIHDLDQIYDIVE